MLLSKVEHFLHAFVSYDVIVHSKKLLPFFWEVAKFESQ